MSNKLPESDDALDEMMVRRLLTESEITETPELLEGLRRLRSSRSAPAPEPSGKLADLLQGSVTPLPKRSRRRGVVLSFALAGAMAAGTTGVAASDEARFSYQSLFDGFDKRLDLPVGGSAENGVPDAKTTTGQQEEGIPADDAAATGTDLAADLPAALLPDTGAPATSVSPGTPVPLAAAVPPADTAASPARPASPAGSASPAVPGAGARAALQVPAVPPPAAVKPVETGGPAFAPQPRIVPQPRTGMEGPGRSRGVEEPVPQRSAPQESRHDDARRGAARNERGGRDDGGRSGSGFQESPDYRHAQGT